MKALIIPVLLALSGCASTQYPVQYVSNPPNAMVVCNGKPLGYTPITLYYELTAIRDNRLTMNCQAKWVSGASEAFPRVVNTVQYPSGVTATANRPSYAENELADNQAAMYGAQNRQGGGYDPRQDEYKFVPNKTTTCNKIGGQTFCSTY